MAEFAMAVIFLAECNPRMPEAVGRRRLHALSAASVGCAA